MPETDFNLTEIQVRAAQTGDAAALSELFQRYLPRVRRIVANRIGERVQQFASCEDIVQETLKDALCGIRKLEQNSDGAFCNWLARCVENNVRDQSRRQQAWKRGKGEVRTFADLGESHLTASLFEGRDPSPSYRARAQETEDQIEHALLQLSDRYREVINLRVYCEMPFREIAQTMGLTSENTANALFLRARDKLSRMLESSAR